MKIGINVDGVLADFVGRYRLLLTTVTKRDLWGPNPTPPDCWGFDKVAGYTSAERSAVWQVIKESPDFWRSLPSHTGAWDICTMLAEMSQQGHDVYYVTSRPGRTAKRQTQDWLEVYGEWAPTVLLSDHKGWIAKGLELDYYVDDRLKNAIDTVIESPETRVFLLDRPWNQVRSLGTVDITEIPRDVGPNEANVAFTRVRRIARVEEMLDEITSAVTIA